MKPLAALTPTEESPFADARMEKVLIQSTISVTELAVLFSTMITTSNHASHAQPTLLSVTKPSVESPTQDAAASRDTTLIQLVLSVRRLAQLPSTTT